MIHLSSTHAFRIGRLLATGPALLAAHALACSVSTSGVDFGAYDPFSNTSLNSAGTITVDCSSAYTVTLSSGAGSYASRTLSSGTNSLSYNLYVDATRTLVWGDGSGGTASISDSGSASPVDYTVYGRIPAQQNAAVGNYSDNIVVTLTF